LIRRVLWKVLYAVVGVVIFLAGMEWGYYRAKRNYESALSKIGLSAAAANGKSDISVTDPKKIVEVKPPPATKPADLPKKPEPAKPASPKPADPPEPAPSAMFTAQIQPILQAKCVLCHGGRAMKGELDVRTIAALRKGGENGPAVVPGDAKSSVLWEYISRDRMPPGKNNKLTMDEKKLIQDWIAGGAK
jgi:uncharacterized membrane protein